MKCEYCGTRVKGLRCPNCGAPVDTDVIDRLAESIEDLGESVEELDGVVNGEERSE